MLLLNKITKLKAIHNINDGDFRFECGAFTEQNYKIESNSQRATKTELKTVRVLLLNKITKLKAIHNTITPNDVTMMGAFTEQNYKIESNSQQILEKNILSALGWFCRIK